MGHFENPPHCWQLAALGTHWKLEVHQKWIIPQYYPAFNPVDYTVHYTVDTSGNTTSATSKNEAYHLAQSTITRSANPCKEH